jgi:hypothetical protein
VRRLVCEFAILDLVLDLVLDAAVAVEAVEAAR